MDLHPFRALVQQSFHLYRFLSLSISFVAREHPYDTWYALSLGLKTMASSPAKFTLPPAPTYTGTHVQDLLYSGPEFAITRGLSASVLAADATATSYVIPHTALYTSAGQNAVTIVMGPWAHNQSSSGSYKVYSDQVNLADQGLIVGSFSLDCSMSGLAMGDCSFVANGTNALQAEVSTSGAFDPARTQANWQWLPVTVTAGAEKLDKVSSTEAKATTSASTKADVAAAIKAAAAPVVTSAGNAATASVTAAVASTDKTCPVSPTASADTLTAGSNTTSSLPEQQTTSGSRRVTLSKILGTFGVCNLVLTSLLC